MYLLLVLKQKCLQFIEFPPPPKKQKRYGFLFEWGGAKYLAPTRAMDTLKVAHSPKIITKPFIVILSTQFKFNLCKQIAEHPIVINCIYVFSMVGTYLKC